MRHMASKRWQCIIIITNTIAIVILILMPHMGKQLHNKRRQTKHHLQPKHLCLSR